MKSDDCHDTCLARPDRESQRAGLVWKRAALVVGGVAIGAAGATVIILAATHTSAVTENAIAYVNGLVDGYSKGLVEGYAVGFVEGVEGASTASVASLY